MKKKTFINPKVDVIPVPREGVITGSCDSEENNYRNLQIEEGTTKSNIRRD